MKERHLDTVEDAGSDPAMPTTISGLRWRHRDKLVPSGSPVGKYASQASMERRSARIREMAGSTPARGSLPLSANG